MTERLESPLRREQIAEAALDIVVEEGLGAVTVRRVAEAVGISAAALYRHYKNKGDIIQAVLEEHQAMHMDNIRQARRMGKTPLDALRILYLSVMKLVERYRVLPVVFLSDVLWFEEPRLKELTMTHHRTVRTSLVELLVEAQQQGEVRTDIHPDQLFVYFLGLIAMPAMMIARDPSEVDMPRQAQANWQLFVQSVRL